MMKILQAPRIVWFMRICIPLMFVAAIVIGSSHRQLPSAYQSVLIEAKQHDEDGKEALKEPAEFTGPFLTRISPTFPNSNPAAENIDLKSERERFSKDGTEFLPPLLGYKLKLTDTLLATFTFLLFVATFLLWRSTEKLWEAGRGQLAIAEAALTGQAPYVFVKIIEPGIANSVATRLFWREVKTKYILQNLGKAPAFINEIHCKVVRSAEMPGPIDVCLTGGAKFPYGTIIGVDANSDAYECSSNIPTEEATPDSRYFFLGFIRYSDNLGNAFTSGFCFLYDASKETYSLFGYDEYNFRNRDRRTEDRIEP
jgi:hypothetical protein